MAVFMRIVLRISDGTGRAFTLGDITPISERLDFLFNDLSQPAPERQNGVVYLPIDDIKPLRVFRQYVVTKNVSNLLPILAPSASEGDEVQGSDKGGTKNKGSSEGPEKDDKGDQNVLWLCTKRGLVSSPPSPLIDLLIASWELGEYLKAPAFQNAIMDQLYIQYWTLDRIPVYNLSIIFDPAITDDALRLMVFEAVRYQVCADWFDTLEKMGLLPDLITKMMTGLSMGVEALKEKREREGGCEGEWKCAYHLHPKGNYEAKCEYYVPPKEKTEATREKGVN